MVHMMPQAALAEVREVGFLGLEPLLEIRSALDQKSLLYAPEAILKIAPLLRCQCESAFDIIALDAALLARLHSPPAMPQKCPTDKDGQNEQATKVLKMR